LFSKFFPSKLFFKTCSLFQFFFKQHSFHFLKFFQNRFLCFLTTSFLLLRINFCHISFSLHIFKNQPFTLFFTTVNTILVFYFFIFFETKKKLQDKQENRTTKLPLLPLPADMTRFSYFATNGSLRELH